MALTRMNGTCSSHLSCYVSTRPVLVLFGLLPLKGEARLTPPTLCSTVRLPYSPRRRVGSIGRHLRYVAPGDAPRSCDQNGYRIITHVVFAPTYLCVLTCSHVAWYNDLLKHSLPQRDVGVDVGLITPGPSVGARSYSTVNIILAMLFPSMRHQPGP